MARLLIFGAGGHGKVVADIARSAGHSIVGFIDAKPELRGKLAEPGGGLVVLSEAELLEAHKSGDALPGGATAVVVAVGDNGTRLRLLTALGRLACEPLVHASAVVSAFARVGSGTVICPRAVVNTDTALGSGVIVNTGAIVEHDCAVGDGVHLSPATTLCGGVRVGARSWIGAGATVIPGVSIGADVIVGAGSVVVRNVADGQMVLGVPARSRSGR